MDNQFVLEFFIWSGLIILNIFVFSVINLPKTWSEIVLNQATSRVAVKVLLSALISNIILHFFVVILGGFDKILPWIVGTFPYVMFLNIVILLVALLSTKAYYKFRGYKA